jgi:hypothetical protein
VNSNILIAFAAGAVIASGIVYIAVRPEDAAPLPAPVVVRPQTPVSVAVAQVDPPSAVIPPPVAQEPVVASVRVPAIPPVREKPSPLRPPPVRLSRPVVIARNEPLHQQPLHQSAPLSPMPAQPAPVPESRPEPVVAPPAPQPEAPALPSPMPQTPPQMLPQTRTPNTVTIQPGTILAVRIGETISSVRNEAGDGFVATLERPLVIDGFVIAERGARVQGRVVETQHPGRLNGPSNLGVEIVEVSTSDGQRIRVHTATFKKDSASSYGGDLANVVLVRGKPVEIPADTRMVFRVQDPLTITEHLQ